MAKARTEAKGDERRLYSDSGVRIAKDDGSTKLTIEGCAYRGSATITDSIGKFTERFSPGAAKGLIERGGMATDGRDVYLNVGHSNEIIPLARTSSKTLRLFEKNGELRFQADLDLRQTTASDVAVAISNGNLGAGGVSVGMHVLRDTWNATQTERTIHDVDLREISLVPHGAYMETSIELAKRGIYVAESTTTPRPTGRMTTMDLRRMVESDKRERAARQRDRMRQDLDDIRLERECRGGYSAKARAEMAQTHEAMADGSFPVKTANDLAKAVKMVGLTKNPKPAVRRHLMRRAKALGLSHMIPAHWAADGTTKTK